MMLMLFYFILPLLIFYAYSNAPREHLYIVLLAVVLINIFKSGRPVNFPLIKEGELVASNIMWFGLLIVTAWMIWSGATSYFNLDF